jgi:cytochrome c peroxidase
MLAPVRNSLAKNLPIHWQRVHRLPDYVYFDHSIHIAKGVGCTSCHGAVDRMPLMTQAAPLTMGWCLDCHRDPAKHLRPKDQIFSTDWQPGADQAEQGHKLLADYGIRVDHLTDCSVCHR